MNAMPIGAPLLNVLSTIIEGVEGPVVKRLAPNDSMLPQARFVVASYRESFATLWRLVERPEGLAVSGDLTTLLLLWDGFPRGSMASPESTDILGHVTAYDWVVAAALAATASKPVPALRVILIDATAGRYQSTFGKRELAGLLRQMPWVRVYRAVPRPSAPAGSDFSEPADLTQLIADLASRDNGTGAANVLTRDSLLLSELRKRWSRELLSPGDRHAVSNALAPLFLRDALVAENWPGAERLWHDGKSVAAEALRILLSVLAILPVRRPVAAPPPRDESVAELSALPMKSPLNRDEVREDVFSRFSRVRFLLIDDQVDAGYPAVLACLLFGDAAQLQDQTFGYVRESRFWSLRYSATPDELLAWLYSASGIDRERTESHSICGDCGGRDTFARPYDWKAVRLIGSGAQPPAHLEEFDVLLLDLRLFGAQAEPGGGEEAFIQALLDFYHESGLCAALISGSAEDAPLLAAARAAGERLHEIRTLRTNPSSNDLAGGALPDQGRPPPGVEPHLLLPLLLIRVDPSLPIVLFSSAENLPPHSGLSQVPRFTKPRLTGTSAYTSLAQVLGSLSQAISRALELHENRIGWCRIVLARARIETATSSGTGQGRPELSIGIETAAERLGRVFREYLLSRRYGDLLLRTGELIDGHAGATSTELTGLLGWISEICRSGQSPVVQDDGDERLRRVALLAFLLLADAVEGIETFISSEKTHSKRRAFRNLIRYIYRDREGSPLRLRSIARSRQTVVDSFAFTISATLDLIAREASKKGMHRVPLGEDTIRAVHRAAEVLIRRAGAGGLVQRATPVGRSKRGLRLRVDGGGSAAMQWDHACEALRAVSQDSARGASLLVQLVGIDDQGQLWVSELTTATEIVGHSARPLLSDDIVKTHLNPPPETLTRINSQSFLAHYERHEDAHRALLSHNRRYVLDWPGVWG